MPPTETPNPSRKRSRNGSRNRSRKQSRTAPNTSIQRQARSSTPPHYWDDVEHGMPLGWTVDSYGCLKPLFHAPENPNPPPRGRKCVPVRYYECDYGSSCQRCAAINYRIFKRVSRQLDGNTRSLLVMPDGTTTHIDNPANIPTGQLVIYNGTKGFFVPHMQPNGMTGQHASQSNGMTGQHANQAYGTTGHTQGLVFNSNAATHGDSTGGPSLSSTNWHNSQGSMPPNPTGIAGLDSNHWYPPVEASHNPTSQPQMNSHYTSVSIGTNTQITHTVNHNALSSFLDPAPSAFGQTANTANQTSVSFDPNLPPVPDLESFSGAAQMGDTTNQTSTSLYPDPIISDLEPNQISTSSYYDFQPFANQTSMGHQGFFTGNLPFHPHN